MKQKKNILMVHNFYQIGGGEHTVFKNEVELLKAHGHKVITYTRDNNELNNSKIKLLLLPMSMIWSIRTYTEVKKIIKKEKIDIVHCHNTFPLISPSVYYASRSKKIPVIQTIHNFRFLCPNGLFYRNNNICEECLKNKNFKCAIESRCYRKSRIQTILVSIMLKFHRIIGTYRKISYIFLTEFNKKKFKDLIDLNSDNVFIKPNFVNKININNLKKFRENKFVYIGRLDENKGIRFLIDVWEKENIKYELHIYGDGPLKKYVEDISKKNSNIEYFGFKPQDVIFNDLVTSSGLIFPSECFEGFPMTITESFSIGIPVISTDIGNQMCIIEKSKGGIFFKLNDNKSFLNAIDRIINDFELYSKNAKKYYQDFLSPEKNYQELVSIYDKAKHIN